MSGQEIMTQESPGERVEVEDCPSQFKMCVCGGDQEIKIKKERKKMKENPNYSINKSYLTMSVCKSVNKYRQNIMIN